MAVPLSFFFSSPDDADTRGANTVTRAIENGDAPHSPAKSSAISDAALIARIRTGDLDAFETIFRAWHVDLCTFAARYLHSIDVAEDVVEDVFASLWMRRAVWDPQAGIRAYLFGAVRNRALVTLRDAGRRSTALEQAAAESSPSSSADGDERLARVWAAVAQLPETQRAVVTMRWEGELSFPEIAAALGTSTAAIKMQLSRAMRAVREMVREG